MRSGLLTLYRPECDPPHILCNTNLNGLRRWMLNQLLMQLMLNPEPPNPVDDVLTICGIAIAANCATLINSH